MTSLRARVEELRRSDATKNSLLEELLKNVDTLTAELQKSQAAARQYLDDMNQAKSEAHQVKRATDCDKFVLVLIDGDSMPFLDDFVAKGVVGGIEAGRKLRTAIEEYHRANASSRPDDRLLIQVYANLRGLGKACHQAKITREESSFADFAAGFGSSNALTSFIDAGPQKEAADSKMRAHMSMFYRNIHCKHIIFGGSDNGYAGFLDDYANTASINERITVLNASHIPFQLARTIKQFRSTSLPDVFRHSKIETHPTNGAVRAGTKRPFVDPNPTPQRRPSPPRYQDTPSSIQAVNGMTPVQLEQPPMQSKPPPTVSAYNAHHQVYVNRYGQRLDPPIEWDNEYLHELFRHKSKLCNNFYLKSYCPFGDKCQWDHSERLNHIQLDTLRHKARTSACRNPFCRDADCTLGHVCPRGSACNISMCKFLPEMHNIEMREVYLLDTATDSKRLVQSND